MKKSRFSRIKWLVQGPTTNTKRSHNTSLGIGALNSWNFIVQIILHLREERRATPHSVWCLCTAHSKAVSTENSASSTKPLVTFVENGRCYLHTKDTDWVDLNAPSTLTLESRMWNPSSAISRLFFGTLKLWTSQVRLWSLCLLPNLKLTQSHWKCSFFFPPSVLNKLNFKQVEFCFSC